MSRDFKDIVAEVLELPLTARAELASQLLESLDDLSEEESDALWAIEAERRLDEYEAGRIRSIPAEEVFARLVYALVNDELTNVAIAHHKRRRRYRRSRLDGL